MAYQTAEQLQAGMASVLDAPKDEGVVRLVVRRPARGQREILAEGQLDTERGLVGDDWVDRPGMNRETPSPYAQVTVMNARAAELVSGEAQPEAWAQCGDQLYIDLDISEANLPAGTRIAVGEAVLELQAEPHTGCVQFRGWWGPEALRHISTEEGRALRMRGANTRVVQSGAVRPGDDARKI
jgi:MOSC domain-containing protein YiiM